MSDNEQPRNPVIQFAPKPATSHHKLTPGGHHPKALWKNYIYRGVYTLLSGHPGLGKGFIGCDLLARASRGGPWPTESRTFEPMKCLILRSEDDADTFSERLEAAGANLDNILIDESFPQFTNIGPLLQGIDLLFVETMDAHMPSTMNANDNLVVRQVLQDLMRTLHSRQTAMIGVKHWNKSSSENFSLRVSGAVAFAAASRVNLSVVVDPQKRRYLTNDKCSFSPELPPLRYVLSNTQIHWGEYDTRVSIGLSPEDVDSVTFLQDFLADGAHTAKEVQAAARACGITPYLLNKAKAFLLIKPIRRGFGPKGWWEWSLQISDVEGPQDTPVEQLPEQGGEDEE